MEPDRFSVLVGLDVCDSTVVYRLHPENEDVLSDLCLVEDASVPFVAHSHVGK